SSVFCTSPPLQFHLLFWGDQNGGTRTGTASSDEAEASKNAGRGNLARSCAQDRRADQDNNVPRRSPSGFVGVDDDYDQPEEPTPVRNAASCLGSGGLSLLSAPGHAGRTGKRLCTSTDSPSSDSPAETPKQRQSVTDQPAQHAR